jgi:hypothetical protein
MAVYTHRSEQVLTFVDVYGGHDLTSWPPDLHQAQRHWFDLISIPRSTGGWLICDYGEHAVICIIQVLYTVVYHRMHGVLIGITRAHVITIKPHLNSGFPQPRKYYFPGHFQDKITIFQDKYTSFKRNKSRLVWKSIAHLFNIWRIIDIFIVQPPPHSL